MFKLIISLFTLVLICSACSKNSATTAPGQTAVPSPTRAAGPGQPTVGELRSKVPAGWVTEKPTSEMRFAQYKLPRAAGDAEDALLVVYYFGQGQGGSAEANIDRWINQIKQPDGGPSKDKAKTDSLTINGLSVNTVDVVGNYAGGMSPDSAPSNRKSIYRLRGAVIDTPKGSYFVKLTGPEKTVGHWDQAYTDYIKSFEFK